MRRRLGIVAVTLAGILAAGVPAGAHELGAMKVVASFDRAGGYKVRVSLDPAHAGAGDAAGVTASVIRKRWIDASRLEFDGEAVTAGEISGPSQPRPSGAIQFTLAGRVPDGARSFQWSNALARGTYLFGSNEEGDTDNAWQWLEGGASCAPVALHHAPPRLTRSEIFQRYLALGFTHILPGGIDHVLFVLGLFLLNLRWRAILTQVTAFTVAHSITLGLSLYGIASLSPRVVEPLIALSIAYVAIENLFTVEARARRVAIVFAFGLLHGLGFAGALRELGLPRAEFLTALLSFNVGVEGGQLAVIAIAFLAVGIWFGKKAWYRTRLTMPASVLISIVGLYWTVQRLIA